MVRPYKLALLLLPLLTCLLVLIDTPFHRLSTGTLRGVVRDVSRPSVSLRELWSGDFQAQYERWFEQELAFRPAIVRTANSLNLLVFREISAHTGVPNVLGKHATLFEMNYIDDANAVTVQKGDVPPPGPHTVQESARRLGRAARQLGARGIAFVVVLYPTKVWLEPELMPSRFLLPGGREKATAGYKYLLDQLHQNEVPVIDGVEVFSGLRKSMPDLPLYNRGGTHWTHAGACFVAQRIVGEIVEHAPNSTDEPHLRCQLGPPQMAEGVDVDIAELSNVWDISRFREPVRTVRPRLSGKIPGGARSTLVVGTSFSAHLIWALQAARVMKQVRRISYYRHTDSKGMNWQGDVAHRGLIVLEQSQSSFLTINSSEFVDDLLQELAAAP